MTEYVQNMTGFDDDYDDESNILAYRTVLLYLVINLTG